jgi:Plasmid pRiA4b ORF-3-like protein
MRWQEPNALQIRVALAEIEPAIWRRLIVPLSFHLGQLHRVIQAAFAWWDYHLHEFRIGGLSYCDAEVCEPRVRRRRPQLRRERGALARLRPQRGPQLPLRLRLRRQLEAFVEFERRLALDLPPRAASCIDGARARPPEDVGGVHGYAGFLDIIADPNNPEHRDTKRWAGGHFDPEWFDREMTDKDVHNALRANRRVRLRQPRPKNRTPSS